MTKKGNRSEIKLHKCWIGFLLQMIEVMEGAGVYWYLHQRAYCSPFKSWQGYINAAIDIFFRKETLSAFSAMGNEKKARMDLVISL